MSGFAKFVPIEQNVREEALKYYNDNNIPLPDNNYFSDFLQIPQSNTGIDESMTTFNAGKNTGSRSKSAPKTNIPKIKEILPAFTKWNEYKAMSEYPKDHTIDIQVEKADNKYPGKQPFLEELDTLNLQQEDRIFLTKLAEKESSFRPTVVNQLGYKGYYQFGRSALKAVGKTSKDFKDPKVQHEAALKLADLNMIPLNKYVGKVVNGITLTKNSLRAAAHLAGATGTKDWIEGTKRSDFAKRGFIDANGTHITKYLKEFSL